MNIIENNSKSCYNKVRISNFLTYKEMQTAILTLQSKGQVMIPKSWRDEMNTSVYQAIKDGDLIILKPIQIASDKEVLKAASKLTIKHSKLLKNLAQ